MLPPALLRALLHSPLVIRFVGALVLVAVLALAGSGALLARPLGPEPEPAASAQPLVEVASAAAVEPNRPPALALAASAPTATSAPTSTPTAPPAARAVADLQAVPPAPNPALPSWAVNTRETGLWSGPGEAVLFSKVPAGATFRVLERQGGRFRAFYPGDRRSRPPGEVWIDAADLNAVPWPHWVRLRRAANVVTRPAADGLTLASLREGDFVEVVGEARGNWAHVYFLGDGRLPRADGWLEADSAAPIPGPDLISSFALSYDLLKAGGPDPWLKVPYRSQIDGTPYAEANCGPTSLGMALEAFGIKLPQPVVRREVLSLQPAEDCDDCGVYIENLAEVAARHGLKVTGLRDAGPTGFHRWTQDDIRNELKAGHPVIAQVFYRRLPARSNSGYWGDHFIVLTGILGDRFVFNDPIDAEGPGFSRLINAEMLDLAMAESDFPYAAFSIGRQ